MGRRSLWGCEGLRPDLARTCGVFGDPGRGERSFCGVGGGDVPPHPAAYELAHRCDLVAELRAQKRIAYAR